MECVHMQVHVRVHVHMCLGSLLCRGLISHPCHYIVLVFSCSVSIPSHQASYVHTITNCYTTSYINDILLAYPPPELETLQLFLHIKEQYGY